MRKMKKTLLVLSSLFMLSGAVVATTATTTQPTQAIADENVPDQVVAEDLRQAEAAKENLYINVDLNNVVNRLYLPTKGLYDAKITWVSSDTNVIANNGTVKRQTEAKDVILTATINVRTASLTKEFKAHVLAATSNTYTRPLRFEEHFSDYKTDQDLSNYYIWELKNDDQIAKIRESVQNNNMVKANAETDKVLEIEPLSTLYKDSIYQTKVNLASSMVFETYIMTSGDLAGFQIEFGTNSSTKLHIGFKDGNFVTGKNKFDEETGVQTEFETLTPYDDGVWYKLRVEMNIGAGKFEAYYYDWKNDGKLVSITKEGGESCKGLAVGQNNYFRMRTLTGRHNGKIYLSNVVIDETSKMPENPGQNPNRSLGIGKIDNFIESYLLVENEDFTLPELVVHNRFGNKNILVAGTDYTLTKEYGESGPLDITKQGNYEITYKINLLNGSEVIETKELKQTFYVDKQDATAQLSTLRIAPIVRDTDETYVNKKVKISANINRKDSTVYYAAVESGSQDLTSEQVVNQQGLFHGSLRVEDSSFSIELEGLDKTKEYNFFVVTKNANGVSEIYSKRNVSVSVYNIEDKDDFFFMCTDPEVQTTDFRLLVDLDFEGYYWAANEITRPNYVGTFDGQGHTIKNLKIVAPYKKASLFYNFAGTFKNLNFVSCTLEGNESVGFIGGYGAGGAHVDNVTMTDCTVKCYSTLSAGDGYYGLIFGRCEGGSKMGNALIENVEIVNGYVEGPKYVGALAGNLQKMDSLKIHNVYCQVQMKSDGAALGLISRARAPLEFKNIVADIEVLYAKKQAAVLCGEMITQVYAENVLGKLKIHGLTQPTYYNNVTGNYSTADGVKFTYKNLFFFEPDTSIMSEDTVVSVASSLSVGTILYGEMGTTKEWWEKNTWLVDLDTNANWTFSEELQRPVVQKRDFSTLSFTAEQVNHYIDQIGNTISSKSLYYIRKALELLKYTPESEKAKVHMDVLNKAIADYETYYNSFTNSLGSIDAITSATTGGIDWSFTPKGGN